MHVIGGDRWSWSLAASRPIEFCVWTLIQDGLRVPPFDVHPRGNDQVRQAGMDPTEWTRWFETVVNREVEDAETLRLGGDLKPSLFYRSDPPTIAEQLQMKEALGATSPPRLWKGSQRAGQLLDDLWDDYALRPPLRRTRQGHESLYRDQPGTVDQHRELYGMLRSLGSSLPSLICYPVVYPALVVREVAPMSLVMTNPKAWTWERYREALRTGVRNLAAQQDR
jgi:hypothetical protein